LQVFPGVGVKSAQRMAIHLLQKDKEGGEELAKTMQQAFNKIKHCSKCRFLTENEICEICSDERRNQTKICVVHSHYDVVAFESANIFDGVYFVLHGALSPIDGIDSQALAIDMLVDIVKKGEFSEVILATNSSSEGEMTSYFIQQHIKKFVSKITKLAQGIPFCSEVELLDINTLSLAFADRKFFD
jgi:recombination protein RecR